MAKRRSQYEEVEAKPKNDAYTGLLALSLIALLASCVVLYLDYAQYGSTEAPKVSIPTPNQPGGPINQGAPASSQAPGKLADLVAEPLPSHTGTNSIMTVGGETPADNEGPALGPPN